MKRICCAAVAAASLLLVGHLRVTAAGAARFRHLASIYFDDRGVGLSLPEGVACGGDGLVVAGDTGNDRLLRFTFRDKTVSGLTAIKPAGLSAPGGLQLNSKGEIYALDGRQRRVVRLDAAGTTAGVLAFDGVPPPATVIPKAMAIDASDALYVLDVFSARVLVIDGEGKFRRALPVPEGAGFGTDIAIDQAGALVLLDSVGRRLYAAAKGAAAFSSLGGDLSGWLASSPAHVAVSKGLIFVLEGSGGSIVGFGRDGSFLSRPVVMGREEGALNRPSQICVNDRDEVFVADRDNSRIQVFQLLR
ncbi:MAG TPA: NHL repeat-containing protein [Vicinamibacterales bacterium]|nr:NHL repeat-containing protein [Vicinamibacterales bacterium]HPW20261.1 NHL repeat-containing protein [Vicinamibacterales bacterium]